MTNIRVGVIRYDKNYKKIYPSYEGYTLVEVMTKSTQFGDLGPYVLKNEEGQIMENIWQFTKVYPSVPATIQKYSRFDNTVVWNHPAEKHVDGDGTILPAYWDWRDKGINNPYHVRYPVGYSKKARGSCLYHLWNDEKLDYVQARTKIYYPIYTDLVKRQPKFHLLKKMLNDGKKLLIAEVDGPQEHSMSYYKDKYNVPDNWIENYTIEITPENMEIMLSDTRHPFGHGYCLAMALLDLEIIN